MQRRNILAGLGALAIGSGAIGTGAFTTVDATRNVSVTVADEDQAYLALDESDDTNSVFANAVGPEELKLDFNDELSSGMGSGTGVGRNSEYEFDCVFTVENQGTQTVYVTIDTVQQDPDSDSTDEVTVEFYVRDGGSRKTIDGTNELELSAGTSQEIGVLIDVGSVDFSGDNVQLSGSTTVTAKNSSSSTVISG